MLAFVTIFWHKQQVGLQLYHILIYLFFNSIFTKKTWQEKTLSFRLLCGRVPLEGVSSRSYFRHVEKQLLRIQKIKSLLNWNKLQYFHWHQCCQNFTQNTFSSLQIYRKFVRFVNEMKVLRYKGDQTGAFYIVFLRDTGGYFTLVGLVLQFLQHIEEWSSTLVTAGNLKMASHFSLSACSSFFFLNYYLFIFI